MKKLNNFAARQLTKKQMNEVKGGTVHIRCAIFVGERMVAISQVEGDTAAEAMLKLNATVLEGGASA